MKDLTLTLTLIIFLNICSYGQVDKTDLYMSLEYQRAYEKGTRKYDGAVSPMYWQNRSVYNLKAKVFPLEKLLIGEATITYFNLSPDSLSLIVFHTYPDYYKIETVHAGRYFDHSYSSNIMNDGMIIDELIIDTDTINLNDHEVVSYWQTNYGIVLSKPLTPDSSLIVKVKWHYEIPGKGFRRSGAIDSTAMFIGYWYPEISVRDDINGWDRIPYNGEVEFYHDFSDYKVEIEVPAQYIVWASIPPLNSDQIYPEAIKERLRKAQNSEYEVTIVGIDDYDNEIKMNTNIWKYQANNFPDFSFALSDHFIWEACKYQDQYGNFLLHTVYDTGNVIFEKALMMQKESLEIFHNEFPKYPFPYEHFIVFNGMRMGGMEFPGMTNVGVFHSEFLKNLGVQNVSDYDVNMQTVFHEMFHMYFPFMMGINEKLSEWMDEGWAVYAEFFSQNRWEDPWEKSILGSQNVSPIMVPSHTQPFQSSYINILGTSLSYYSLYHLLGEGVFKECLKTYMDRWKNKHPSPYDFMFTFNDISGKDLNWFWKRWYFDWGYPDLSIKYFKNNDLVIENKGGRPLAFSIVYGYEDGTTSIEIINPDVWKNASIFKKEIESGKRISTLELKILGGYDAVKENSIWTKGDVSDK